jgi:hypothetical protein
MKSGAEPGWTRSAAGLNSPVRRRTISFSDASSGVPPLCVGLPDKWMHKPLTSSIDAPLVGNTTCIKSGSARAPTSSHSHQGQALCVGPRALTRMRSSYLSGTEPEAKATALVSNRRVVSRVVTHGSSAWSKWDLPYAGDRVGSSVPSSA